jgi:hypothetical protein
MKLTYRVTLLCLLFVAVACQKDKVVTACIELDKTTVNAGDSITFTSCSENEWSYIWEITGPDSATENGLMWNDRVFTRAMSVPGSYQVKLTTFNDFSFLGDSATDSTSFIVN